MVGELVRVLGSPGRATGEKVVEMDLKRMRDDYLSSSSFDSVKKFHKIGLSSLHLPWEVAKKEIEKKLQNE